MTSLKTLPLITITLEVRASTLEYRGQNLGNDFNSPVLCQNLVHKDLIVFLLQVIALVHYIELSKVEIATTLNFLVRYLCVEEWETDKNSGALYLRVQ